MRARIVVVQAAAPEVQREPIVINIFPSALQI